MEVLLYLESHLDAFELREIFQDLGRDVCLSMKTWLARSIVEHPIPDILRALENRGWDIDDLRAAVWSYE